MSTLKIRVWDVKHGNAIYVQTPNNKHLVYDLGRGDYSENSDDRSPLETLYNHYKVRTIDYLMITHPHKDHIDDILLLNKFNLKVLQRPKGLDKATILNGVSDRDRPKFEKYFDLDERYTYPVPSDTDINVPSNFGGVAFQTFQTTSLPESNLNNRSILSVLSYEGLKVIIPGDNEYASLDLLMQRSDFKDAVKNCDILIAPHHGRESAYHSDFVSLANPRLTIISDGSLCDTSANPKYTQKSRGWKVWYKGIQRDRYLLTTNTDGEIYIDIWSDQQQRNLYVEIK